jgi:hypothetical protein
VLVAALAGCADAPAEREVVRITPDAATADTTPDARSDARLQAPPDARFAAPPDARPVLPSDAASPTPDAADARVDVADARVDVADARVDVADGPVLPGDAAPGAPPPDAARVSPPDATAPQAVDLDEAAWAPGDFTAGPPRIPECAPLPGGGEGPPLMVSNNPEAFDGPGLLMGNARPTQTRGGRAYRLRGDFGLYLHHLYRGAGSVWLQVVVTNPTDAPVTLDARGSAYTQDEAGGLGLGQSPDYRVTADWARDTPRVDLRGVEVPSRRPVRIWSGELGRNREADGRLWFHTSDDVYVYVVATAANDLNQAVNGALSDAPGDYRISGDPPPPFGREAGVYAHDTWRADFSVGVPAAGQRLGVIVNTATGGGHPQVQAFPALMNLEGSARESVGMYGVVYDLTVRLVNRDPARPRTVRAGFGSIVNADLSRYWDGVGRRDAVPLDLRHTPDARTTPLGEFALAPGETRSVHLEAMVPGLTSIPQALLFESVP